MRVCMLSKYPPIEGGVASRTYWLANGLSDHGISVDIVTNSACVEPEYRIEECQETELNGNLRVHSLDRETPWHIPYSQNYLIRLLNLVLRALRGYKCDVIDTGYLIPYGVAGWLASKLTGVPYIVRHGGSDLGKFLDHPEYSALLEKVLIESNVVITDDFGYERVKGFTSNLLKMPAYVPDEKAFNVPRKLQKRATFAYIGKINFHWQRRALDKIAEAFMGVPSELYRLMFMAQGKGKDDFLRAIGKLMKERIEFANFIPPWDMPQLLSTIDYVFDFSQGDPIESESCLVKEALAAGAQVITNKNSVNNGVIHSWPFSSENIMGLIRDRGIKEMRPSTSPFNDWVSANIEIYKSISSSM